MPRLVSRAEVARLKGVSKPAVTQACRGLLAPACVRDRIDLDHPAAASYLAAPKGNGAKSDGAPTAPEKRARIGRPAPTRSAKPVRKQRPAPPARRPKRTPGVPAPTAEQLDAFGDLLRPIIEKFGTARAFADWLKAAKDLEVIRSRKLENEETEGRLIARDFVKTHVLGLVEACWRRLLQDAPKTIARRIYAAAKSERPVEEAERVVSEIIGSHLEQLKATAAKLVRNA
jgi:hypothetical protein